MGNCVSVCRADENVGAEDDGRDSVYRERQRSDGVDEDDLQRTKRFWGDDVVKYVLYVLRAASIDPARPPWSTQYMRDEM